MRSRPPSGALELTCQQRLSKMRNRKEKIEKQNLQIGCIKITRSVRFPRMDVAIEGPGRFGKIA